MKTYTKRILTLPYWVVGLLFCPFLVLGVLFEFAKYWFMEGRKVHRDAVALFDPANNDPEHRIG